MNHDVVVAIVHRNRGRFLPHHKNCRKNVIGWGPNLTQHRGRMEDGCQSIESVQKNPNPTLLVSLSRSFDL
jgi:hypothetical protein